jgi:tripartite-type tricarboxylate transporter receptor subunit TctC
MTPTRRRLLRAAATVAATSMIPRFAVAQPYPARPIRLVVGFAAGGNFDIVARLLAQSLSKELGQPVTVENRPGASSNLATASVLRSEADGYTLLLCGTVNAINATLYDNLGFDFVKEIVPVAGLVRFPNVMTVDTSFPAKTVSEFIAYVKANPGRVNHGSSGIGTSQHLAGELFKLMTGTNFVHVPYRGATPAITDMLAGQVQVLFEALPPSIEHVRSGRFRALAVTSATRADALPDISAIGETVNGYEASGWNGVCAPKDTPEEIVRRLNAAINAALNDSELKARLVALGATTMAGSPSDFGKLIAHETDKWAKVIRTANIKAG